MRPARVVCLAAGAAMVAALLAGCGGDGARDGVAIRVAGTPIEMSAVAHWMTVFAPEHVLPVPPHFTGCVSRQRTLARGGSTAELERTCAQRYVASRQQALAFLISSHWAIGEATAQDVKVSPAEVEQRLQQKHGTYSSRAEFDSALEATGQTVSDLRLELEAEIAAEKLRRKLAASERPVSSAEVAAYYRAHARRYHIPEERYFDIGENFRTAAIARKVMRAAKAGRPWPSLRETLPRRPYSYYTGEKRTIYEAIFKAPQNVITGPIPLIGGYFVIDVTRIRRAYVQSLARVRGAIARQLAAEERKRTLAAFIAQWRRRWTSQTNCSPGYVVQKCRQYDGPVTPEAKLSFE